MKELRLKTNDDCLAEYVNDMKLHVVYDKDNMSHHTPVRWVTIDGVHKYTIDGKKFHNSVKDTIDGKKFHNSVKDTIDGKKFHNSVKDTIVEKVNIRIDSGGDVIIYSGRFLKNKRNQKVFDMTKKGHVLILIRRYKELYPSKVENDLLYDSITVSCYEDCTRTIVLEEGYVCNIFFDDL